MICCGSTGCMINLWLGRWTKLFWPTANGATTFSRTSIGVAMFDLLLTKRIGLVFCALLVIGQLAAQESPSPSPSPPARNIRVSFVPPPLDGTISLGIYDAKGKLVRVLFREADINEFTIGSDAHQFSLRVVDAETDRSIEW